MRSSLGRSHRAGFDGVSPYGAYLAGITRNLVIDGLRRSGREALLGVGLAVVGAATWLWPGEE